MIQVEHERTMWVDEEIRLKLVKLEGSEKVLAEIRANEVRHRVSPKQGQDRPFG